MRYLVAFILFGSSLALADLGELPPKEETRELAGQKVDRPTKAEIDRAKQREKDRKEHLKYMIEIDRSRQ